MLVAHISDTHAGAHPEATADLAADLSALAPDLILHSGDITDRNEDAEWKLWADAMAPHGCRLLSVPGNHDGAYAGENRVTLATRGDLHLVTLDARRIPTGLRGWAPWGKGISDAELGPGEVEAVQGLLAACPAGKLPVLMLHWACLLPPGYPVNDAWLYRLGWPRRNTIALGAGLTANAGLVLTGHWHGPWELQRGSQLHLGGGSTTGVRGYRVLTVNGSTVEGVAWRSF